MSRQTSEHPLMLSGLTNIQNINEIIRDQNLEGTGMITVQSVFVYWPRQGYMHTCTWHTVQRSWMLLQVLILKDCIYNVAYSDACVGGRERVRVQTALHGKDHTKMYISEEDHHSSLSFLTVFKPATCILPSYLYACNPCVTILK